MPCSAALASDLGPHCLPMSLVWDAVGSTKSKWVNVHLKKKKNSNFQPIRLQDPD